MVSTIFRYSAICSRTESQCSEATSFLPQGFWQPTMDSWLAIEKAKEIPDALSFFGISTVEQYLGFGASHRSALSLVSTDDGKRECALPVPTRGGTPTLAYRSKRTGRRGRINAP
jgi:hypothetical protein